MNPIQALWSRPEPEDPNDRIDRTLGIRVQRLMAGISMDHACQNVLGALTVTKGQGKYLRLRHSAHASARIPDAVANEIRTLLDHSDPEMGRYSTLCRDLADIQNEVISQLKRLAGKYVDRIVAASVHAPGIWMADIDGQPHFNGFCDATRLAELSGLSVIDDFPSRDVAVGGRGQPLEGLPFWLSFADRDARIASQDRALLLCGDLAGCYILPASDGLDADLPRIQHFSHEALEILRYLPELLRRWQQTSEADFSSLYAAGIVDDSIKLQIARCLKPTQNNRGSNEDFIADRQRICSEYKELCDRLLQHEQKRIVDLVRTTVVTIVDDLFQSLARFSNVEKVIVVAEASILSSLINRIEQVASRPLTFAHVEENGIQSDGLTAVAAAILGLMHIDQMPANLPWLTTAGSQRILGTITPGRPANWRQLIRMMADFQPPAMKLKDAI